MIAFVTGRVAAVSPTSVVVAVGGVGVEIHCTPGTLATVSVGNETTLPTSMVVREESLTLFGFADEDERSLFEMLQTASGVGPRLAQAMLAVLSPGELRRAVSAEDVTALVSVPGIGRKGAQRIVLELKDRIGASAGLHEDRAPGAAAAPWRGQVHAGLVGLGWSDNEAGHAVEAVAPQAQQGEPDVAALLRAALRSLSGA